MKSRIKRGDKVEIVAGNDKGVRGEVIRVVRKGGRVKVAVQGANIRKKHQRQMQVQGSNRSLSSGIIEFEGLIDVSNVMLIDPNGDTPTRVGIRRDSKGKMEARVARKSGETIGK
jgi:large subunit ribosomal protein L24